MASPQPTGGVVSWQERGLCVGEDPREWDHAGTTWARTCCASCDVQAECLTEALQDPPVDLMRARVWFDRHGRPHRLADVTKETA